MSEDEKLNIAQNNEMLRQHYRAEIEKQKILIRYIGKNTTLGIPGNGQYSSDNLEHKLAVIKVGAKKKTPLQELYERKIKEQNTQYTVREAEKERDEVLESVSNLGLKSVSTVTINHNNKLYHVYLYEDDKQFALWKEVHVQEEIINKLRVSTQPKQTGYKFTSETDNGLGNDDLWENLQSLNLSPIDTNQLYYKFQNKIAKDWEEQNIRPDRIHARQHPED
ncbi:unnamed protein product [Arctia plantaginis]|uniref:Uncharacterized protein n=1 Tax=Arctia plantaginis TaxID=874455 RepID=A0A8S0Z4V6_ARCPL|nr:unnamed protein product [Arctia plantaginis]